MGRRIFAAAALALAVTPAFGISLSSLDINAGLIFIGATDPQAAPSPLVATFGASLPIDISGPFFAQPGLDFYGLYYAYTGASAVPTEIETNAGFFTIATLLSLQAGLRFPLTDTLELGATVGIDFLFRFPAELENTSAESIAGRDPALAYFFANARFLYPETRVYLQWKALDILGLVFSARIFYPVFHIWDGEGLPFLDQLMVCGMIGFSIPLK